MDITKYINKRTQEENQIKRFNAMLPDIKTKQELRNLEMHLLKPKPIPNYKGAKSGRSAFQKRTLLLAFPDGSYIKRIAKFFNINSYIQNNTYDIGFLIELICLMEKKRVEWDKDRKRFFIVTKDGRKIRL